MRVKASKIHQRRRRSLWRGVVVGTVAVGGGLQGAQAFDVDTGVPDVKLRWDTTVKYSAAARLKGRSEALLANPNLDDGDRNFSKGLISNRLDLLSEMDVDYKGFGARVSGAAWYDRVYQKASDNDSPGTNNVTTRPFPDFSEGTRNLHGRKGELLDAFVYGNFDLGEGRVGVRAGRHSLLWGESLFFGSNGIGYGMSSIDVIKAVSVPNTQFKELLRPIGQVSSQYQILPNMAVGAYYQYKFVPYRLPGSGSYFSPADPSPVGSDSLLVPAPGGGWVPGLRPGTDVPAKDSGQGGLQLRWRPTDLGIDLGFYAMRYHDRTPQFFLAPAAGQTYFVYPEGIQAYGMSATSTVGEYNLAGEFSVRTHAPLVNAAPIITPVLGGTTGYARGTTLHANFNWLASLGPSFVAQEASFVGEIAANYRQHVSEHPEAIDPNTRRAGLGMRFVYEPTYRQVLTGLDIGVPAGIGYAPMGRSSAGGGLGTHHGGDMSLGLNGTYLAVWKFSLNYTHYYGPEAPLTDANGYATFRQSLKDRDFVSLSMQTTF